MLKLAVVITAAGSCGRLARAQVAPEPDAGPVIIGERRADWNLFELANTSAAFDFLGSSRRERVTQTGRDTTDKEDLLRESLELFTQAYIGHRNFIDLTGKFRLQYENRWVTSGTLSSDEATRDLNLLYDVNARILGASSVPVDIYARRDQQTINRDFGTALRQGTTEYGAIANFQSANFPTTVQLSHNESDQTDSFGQFGYKYKRDSLSVQSILVLSETNRLEARYQFDSVSETQENVYSTDYIRHDLSLNDTWNFGEKKEHELRSFFRYYDQGGLYEQTNIRLEEQLRLVHTDTLESRYSASADQRSRGGASQNTYRGTAALRHKLFESLVSTANAGYQHFTTGDFSSDQYFAGLNFEYTKRIAPGRLDINLGANYVNQNNSDQGGGLSVFDESYQYNGGLFITVNRRNVVSGSLRLTGPGGFPTYLEGVDYTVRYFPDRVEIVPVVGGAITSGSTLLANYDIGPEPGNTISTIGTSAAIRYTILETWLQGLAGYASYSSTTNNVSAADPSLIAVDDVTVTLLGLEYRRWGVTLRAEQEFRDSTLNPYDTMRLQALYDTRLGGNSVFSVDLTDEMIRYSQPSNEVNFLRAGVRWIQELSRTVDLDTRVIYRNESDANLGDSEGIDARVGLRWRYRQTSAYINVGHTIFGTPTSDTTSQLLEIGFRREF